VGVLTCRVEEIEDGRDILKSPLGRPIANTRVFLLDPRLEPVPVGIPGELYIGGDSVTRGYLNQPALTAERFLPDPFSHVPGRRLYKTGDLTRYLTDGNIEFLGRVDSQVKIRGFRVEPGEIEAVLKQHPAVREAAVLAREDVCGEKRLVGYVVARKDRSATATDLRGFLKLKLPEHMVPSVFVFLDAFPLTPNGKVDRRAIPEPDGTRPSLERAFVAPRTAPEKILADIWTEALALERVGVYDNFFELGGHSLSAARVIFLVRKAFEMELPLRALFEKPTIEELALVISRDSMSRPQKEDLRPILSSLEELSEEEANRLLGDKMP
jgi:hypothetical protein